MNSEDFADIFPSLDETINIHDINLEGCIKQEVQHQPDLNHLTRIPNLEKIDTKYEFEVTVPPDNSNVAFNREKLFIKMGTKMTINVAYNQQYRGEPLFVRAMLLFSKPAEMHLPVKRCANHRNGYSGNETDEVLSREANIVKINDPKAVYVGKEIGETFGERLSILVPLESNQVDESGKHIQSIGLEFGCQNSCSSGINRRPVSIVFTLEAGSYELLGKSAIEFKVCSCPKRDAEREQTDRKRKNGSNEGFPRGKRPLYSSSQPLSQPIKPEPCSDSDDSIEHSITTIAVANHQFNFPTEMVPELLKTAFNMVAGKMADESKKGSISEQLEKTLKDIKKIRKKFD